MSTDKQLQYRKRLNPSLNSMSQMACFVQNYHKSDYWLKWELKVDRLMAEAQKELSESEFALLEAWKKKELTTDWNLA